MTVRNKGLTYWSGIYIALAWAVAGTAHFFCLFGISLSMPGFNIPFANTMGVSFWKHKIRLLMYIWEIKCQAPNVLYFH